MIAMIVWIRNRHGQGRRGRNPEYSAGSQAARRAGLQTRDPGLAAGPARGPARGGRRARAATGATRAPSRTRTLH